jgi:preprotein translocase subunit SecD
MTLAGIAGFILSIGMAVDANVLIFGRMKEELHAHRPISTAVEIGFSNAWPAIWASNSTTLISCALRLMVRYGGARNLWWYGVDQRLAARAGAAD